MTESTETRRPKELDIVDFKHYIAPEGDFVVTDEALAEFTEEMAELTEQSLEDLLVKIGKSGASIKANRMVLSPHAIEEMTDQELKLVCAHGLEALDQDRQQELAGILIARFHNG